MRKYINIIGVGDRKSGTAKKSGKAYDFTPVAFTYDDKYIAGLKCATVNISQETMGEYRPTVGDTVEVVMREDFTSGRVYVDAVL